VGLFSLRAIRRLSVVVISIACPASIATGCASCEAKCVGPSAEIFVSNNVASVTVCDAAGVCTDQSFDQPGANVVSRSLTISAVEANGGIPLKVSGVTRTGSLISSVDLLAKPSKGSCGCSGPARVFVDASSGATLPAG
jgi:hypothetical protein